MVLDIEKKKGLHLLLRYSTYDTLRSNYKNVPNIRRCYAAVLFTDFKNFFTATFSGKFAIK